MVLTAGILSLISASSNSANLSSTSASGGTGPYTQQWYRDVSGSGFSPGAGNLISGATALTLNDTNLVPNTTYYYKVVYTDATTSTVTSTAFTVTTLPASQGINQFSINPFLGDLDLKNGPQNIVAVQVDQSQNTPLYPGQPVKFANSPYGIPTVVAAGSNMPNGYLIYDKKSQNFPAGYRCEIAKTGSCIWLYATTAISRGATVVLTPSVASGIQAATGSTDLPIIGEAYDQATAPGQLIRVILNVPSNIFDTTAGTQNFLPPTQQVFKSGSGTYTPTVSSKPVLYIRLQMAAGGGGGEGSAADGIGGGTGGTGGDSTFSGPGGSFTAHGGVGGSFTDGGAGGLCSVTTTYPGNNYQGQYGGVGAGVFFAVGLRSSPNNLSPFLQGGLGGNSLFPGGGQSQNQLNAIANTGGGGAGASIQTDSTVANTFNSGSGGGGGGYLDYILPVGIYTFSVGAAGAAGTAGTSGKIGGLGSAGVIIVTEYYQ